MQILAELFVQYFSFSAIQRFPVVFEVLFGLMATAAAVAGLACFDADNMLAGGLLLGGGLLSLGVAVLSYRERRARLEPPND